MCIMPKVKKCEKTFALNVDIFRNKIFFIISLTFLLISSIMHTTNEMPLRALSNGGITFDKKPSR